jgi:hypothetical protein
LMSWLRVIFARHVPLDSPAYNFNDEATPYGAALLATVVERQLGR